jgi:hypothetical protein
MERSTMKSPMSGQTADHVHPDAKQASTSHGNVRSETTSNATHARFATRIISWLPNALKQLTPFALKYRTANADARLMNKLTNAGPANGPYHAPRSLLARAGKVTRHTVMWRGNDASELIHCLHRRLFEPV